jgi:hypothetical protein
MENVVIVMAKVVGGNEETQFMSRKNINELGEPQLSATCMLKVA